jgi:hypothetical protein
VRFLLFGFVLVLFGGCAGTGPMQPSVSTANLVQLATEYQAALSRDEALSRLSAHFSISDSGAILGTLEVNTTAWGDLSRGQREQIIKRATDLYARHFTTSRASILGVSNVTIQDDMGSTRGWILVCTCGPAEYSLYGSW